MNTSHILHTVLNFKSSCEIDIVLTGSGSWSIILMASEGSYWNSASRKSPKGLEQQLSIFFKFKESSIWYNYPKLRSQKLLKPLRFIIKRLILTYEDIVICLKMGFWSQFCSFYFDVFPEFFLCKEGEVCVLKICN